MFSACREFPYAASAINAVRCSRQQLYALRDHLGLARNVSCRPPSRRDNRAMVDALKHSDGERAGCDGQARSPRWRMHAITTQACVVYVQLRSGAWRFHAEGRTDGDCRPHCPARLACRGSISKRSTCGAVGFLYRAADHHRRRSHGPPRCRQAGDGSSSSCL